MIIVFWLEQGEPRGEPFSDTELSLALRFSEAKRRDGLKHVTISSELGDSIGKPGVDTIADGKTPDGEDYTWKKRRL
jgi:hypothetical protein